MWSFDHSPYHSKPDPIGTVGHWTGGSLEACTSWQQPCRELPGFFEHLLGLAKLQLAGLLVFLGTRTLGLIWLLEFLKGYSQLVNNLG